MKQAGLLLPTAHGHRPPVLVKAATPQPDTCLGLLQPLAGRWTSHNQTEICQFSALGRAHLQERGCWGAADPPGGQQPLQKVLRIALMNARQ